jgi:hypothetical protein
MTVNSAPEPSAPDPSTPDPSVPDPSNLSHSEIAAPPGFGWTQYAEKINGRFAMIGFAALLLTELLSGQNFLTWLMLR